MVTTVQYVGIVFGYSLPFVQEAWSGRLASVSGNARDVQVDILDSAAVSLGGQLDHRVQRHILPG